MNIPKELKYTKEHEWIKVEGDIITIGITDFAQHSLTDIVFVELPEKNKQFEAGKQAAVIESVKSVSDIIAPVAGEIVEVNDKLTDTPEIINKDCYGEGWIFKIKMSNPDEANGLMSADAYSEIAK